MSAQQAAQPEANHRIGTEKTNNAASTLNLPADYVKRTIRVVEPENEVRLCCFLSICFDRIAASLLKLPLY